MTIVRNDHCEETLCTGHGNQPIMAYTKNEQRNSLHLLQIGSAAVNTYFAIGWMTMVNHENTHYFFTIAGYQQVIVRCVDDSFITCRLNPKEKAFNRLKCQVLAKTGIPPNIQQFIAGTKLVTSSADTKDNSTLSNKLCGGSNSDICYSSGSLFICKECKQTLCAECSGRVHHHPKRAHHKSDSFFLCWYT